MLTSLLWLDLIRSLCTLEFSVVYGSCGANSVLEVCRRSTFCKEAIRDRPLWTILCIDLASCSPRSSSQLRSFGGMLRLHVSSSGTSDKPDTFFFFKKKKQKTTTKKLVRQRCWEVGKIMPEHTSLPLLYPSLGSVQSNLFSSCCWKKICRAFFFFD